MKNLFDFGRAYGFGFESVEDEELEVTEEVEVEDAPEPEIDEEPVEAVDTTGETGDTQELQEDIPQIIDTDDVTNVVDDLGDTFEEGYDERPVGDIDYIPEDLKAEIDAIEAQADQHAQVGQDLMLPEEDPYHEVPGGISLTEDAPVQGMDEVEDYAKSINEVNVTGNQGDMDQYMRDEYNEDAYGEDSITSPSNTETTVSSSDASAIDEQLTPNGANALQNEGNLDVKEVEVSASDIDGEGSEDEALGAKDVLGTESEDMDMLEMEESEESESEPEESSEEEPAEEEVPEEVTEEVESDDVDEVEVTVDEEGNETCCAEEHELVASLDVDLNMDTTILNEESTEEAEQAASETELEMYDDALAPVEEMTLVNPPDGETPAPEEDGTNEQENIALSDDEMLSDVVGDMIKDDSHGDDEAVYQGDFSTSSDDDNLNQISEGESSYDEPGESGGDDSESVDEVSEEPEMEEAEDTVEEDAVEDTIDGSGDEIDTPEETDAELEETSEDISEDSDEIEDEEPEEEE